MGEVGLAGGHIALPRENAQDSRPLNPPDSRLVIATCTLL